jgi:hypothetical protein
MSARRRHLCVLAASLLLAAVSLPALATGHTRHDKSHWFFQGKTYPVFEADLGKSDPLNMIYMGARRQVNHNTITFDWGIGSKEEGIMGNSACNHSPFETRQYMIWIWYPNGYGAKQDDHHWNESNDGYSTSASCDNQWHVRLWNAGPHNDKFHPDSNNQFSLAPVHREVKDWVLDTHVISDSYERAEGVMIKQLKERCSWRNWRYLPGSGPGKFQGWPSDGKISRVSPEKVSEPGPCGKDEARSSEFDPDPEIGPVTSTLEAGWVGKPVKVKVCKKKRCISGGL